MQKFFVVNSGSTDQTLEIAKKKAGCQSVWASFKNYAEQLSWAIKNLLITTSWIMRFDADEHDLNWLKS